MTIDLLPVFNITGKSLDIDYTIPAADTDEFPRIGDVHVTGVIENKTDIVTMRLVASYTLTAVCDRCAEEYSEDLDLPIEYPLILELSDERDDSYIEVPGGKLELDELVREDIILDLPFTFLCDDDCKGLCPQCGANLNNGKCNCKKPVDPRLSALLDFSDY